MALELQFAVTRLVVEILGAETTGTPPWLMRPSKRESGRRWPLVQDLCGELTGGATLPETMPTRERRTLDCVLVVGGQHRILEVDEKQHFNRLRAATLRRYADAIPLAFPAPAWISAGEAKLKLEGGGFTRPCPPLFPNVGGRHQQRAFRDALADVLPTEYGWQPTLRIADFEVKPWIYGPDARERMRSLLDPRL